MLHWIKAHLPKLGYEYRGHMLLCLMNFSLENLPVSFTENLFKI